MKITVVAAPRRLYLDRDRAKITAHGLTYHPHKTTPLPCIAVISQECIIEHAFEVEIKGPSKFVHDLTAAQPPAAWIETEAELVLTMEIVK